MNYSNRILFNTVVLYAKILISMFISLWTVPIVLRALGQSDFGLYTLVAGVVTMLSFLNDSMTVVVQRYMSVTMGKHDLKELNDVFNASIRIHLFLGLFIVVLLEICSLFLFTDFLNIQPDRIDAAKHIFQFMIVSTFFTVVSVPFDAALNAYEDMLIFSIVSICESVGKLILAFLLTFASVDRLQLYGFGIALIASLGVIIRYIVVKTKYNEITIQINSKIPRNLYKEMLSYAGWNTFGSIAMIAKNQGISVIFNLFGGTIINAAYGIANQVNGFLSSFAANIQKAVSPQLMKSQGAHNHDAMFELSFSLVKISTIIFSFMAIPLVVEMDYILKLWIGNDMPLYSVSFCRLTLLIQLIFQLSSGVALCIDAVGKIKIYRLILSSVLILNIPLAYIVLKLGYQPQGVFLSMILVEILCLFVRLTFARKDAFFPVNNYLKHCLFPLILCVSIDFGVCFLFKITCQSHFLRLIINIMLSSVVLAGLSYVFVLSKKERDIISRLINRLIKK